MTETIKTLLEPIQKRAESESGCNSDPCGSKVCKAQRDRARLLAAVQAIDGLTEEIEEEAGVLGLNLQEDDFDRGWYGARRDAVDRIRTAIESALSEAR